MRCCDRGRKRINQKRSFFETDLSHIQTVGSEGTAVVSWPVARLLVRAFLMLVVFMKLDAFGNPPSHGQAPGMIKQKGRVRDPPSLIYLNMIWLFQGYLLPVSFYLAVLIGIIMCVKFSSPTGRSKPGVCTAFVSSTTFGVLITSSASRR